jgi:hypothetical protein
MCRMNRCVRCNARVWGGAVWGWWVTLWWWGSTFNAMAEGVVVGGGCSMFVEGGVQVWGPSWPIARKGVAYPKFLSISATLERILLRANFQRVMGQETEMGCSLSPGSEHTRVSAWRAY